MVMKMKLILVADVSANGKLLLTDNPNHPVPKAGVDFYMQKVNQAGNLIIGSKTLETFQHHFGGIQQLFPGIEVVVLSRSSNEANGCKVVHSPEEAVNFLQEKGFKEIVVGGGVQIYNVFLNRDMLTDIYFNYVPVIAGDGGTLGTAADLLTSFELMEHKLLGEGIVQIHLCKVQA
jgi:dihydrofolate reductase